MADENADTSSSCCCASCGIAQVDDVKLKECTACDLVRYCSDACQKVHRKQHILACEQRAAELRDELLFKQPEGNHLGDCPICMLPLPLEQSKSSIMPCCSKSVCNGCTITYYTQKFDASSSSNPSCPFCREPTPITEKAIEKRRMKRIEANDPMALLAEGFRQFTGKNYTRAFEYYTRAAQLGDVDAHYRLADLYENGKGAEKDEGKHIYHLEEAAIRGHPDARSNLACAEWRHGNIERGVKHWIIAAAQGNDGSIKVLMDVFKAGSISKEDLVAALRAHQAAVDATKSLQREVAEERCQKWLSEV